MRNRATLTAVSIMAAFFAPAATFAGQGYSLSNTGQSGLTQEVRDRSRGHENPQPTPDASSAMAEKKSSKLAPGINVGSVDGGQNTASRSRASSARAFGSFGIPYTSTRVAQINKRTRVRSNSQAFLSATYPYSTIGKLTFLQGSDSLHCSAALIRRSVIVTAAHCLKDFGSAGWNSNWQFTPGYYRADPYSKPVQPFGVWNWAYVAVPPSWANGTDTGSGDARNNDLAIIILDTDKRRKFIGDTTGYLSYGWNNYSFISSPKTGDLEVAQITTLGYPGGLDGGTIMQRTDGPTYLTTVDGALQYWQGSNLTNGASGGPWIVNFKSNDPIFYDGASSGEEEISVVIGVTSWGSDDPNGPKDNYSSRFGQNVEYPNSDYGGYGPGNIGALMEEACTAPYWKNTAFTHAQMGFCD
jgi:V8-like Glu-specific endopeptidase